MKREKTYYEILEVLESASPEVIRGAYRHLSQRWHPDRNPDSPEAAHDRITAINHAYQVLSDPEKRQEYDAKLKRARDIRGGNQPKPSAGANPGPKPEPSPRPKQSTPETRSTGDSSGDLGPRHVLRDFKEPIWAFALICIFILALPLLVERGNRGSVKLFGEASTSQSNLPANRVPTTQLDETRRLRELAERRAREAREATGQAAVSSSRTTSSIETDSRQEDKRPPQFSDYETGPYSHIEPHAPVVLRSEFDRSFRTRLRATSTMQPNFASGYVLTYWGCGTNCLMGAAVNTRTGRVIGLPGSVCCWEGEGEKIIFRENSSLIVFAGRINEGGEYGAHFYNLEDEQFRHVLTIPVDRVEQAAILTQTSSQPYGSGLTTPRGQSVSAEDEQAAYGEAGVHTQQRQCWPHELDRRKDRLDDEYKVIWKNANPESKGSLERAQQVWEAFHRSDCRAKHPSGSVNNPESVEKYCRCLLDHIDLRRSELQTFAAS